MISMAINSLTDFARAELSKRLNELEPPRQISDIESVAEAIELIEAAEIEVAVSGVDRMTEVRSVQAKRIRPASFA
jgi:hypothetical protein